MRIMKKRSKLIALLIIMLTFSSVHAQVKHVKVSEVEENDQFMYFYFDLFIQEFAYTLKYMVEDNDYYLNLSKITFDRLELTRDEAIYYQSRGIETKARYVVEPFYQFSKKLLFLGQTNYELQNVIRDLENSPDEELFREANLKIIAMNKTLKEMYSDLDAIDNIELKNGTHILKFNTTPIRKWMEEMEKKISSYLSTVEEISKEMSLNAAVQRHLWIDVSNRNPILFDKVLIYGHTSNPGTVWISIEYFENESRIITKMYQVKTAKDGSFSMSYSFNELKEYKVYATQEINGTRRMSNVVIVRVRKIPTRFIMDSTFEELIGRKLTVRGTLVDYYKKPLQNVKVYVNSSEATTNERGEFFREFYSDSAKKEKVNVVFYGDEIHEGTNKTVEIVFSKYPVNIVLDPEKNKVFLGENVKVKGVITGLKHASPIEIYMNRRLYKVVEANETFELNLNFSSLGTYSIYAFYAGDELHQEAKSNIVTILVVEKPAKMRSNLMVIFLIAVLLGSLLYWKREKLKLPKMLGEREIEEAQGISEEEFIEIIKQKPELPKDVKEAYKMLFEELASAFNLRKSLTPREVLKALKDAEFYGDLKVVTELHEKAVYGGVELSEVERKEFFARMERILEVLGYA
ncbi:Ig-like domain repeat protein [Thermococcus sp. M39]|uniref:Ig-like domain-containing protein n=1 Tax=unclassified Thermococcus TaxID=2627626 RepID=UPI00143AE415|nr:MULTISPECIES: Ig-like domain-containing protein [unclassified Thermococcus]NJE06976.1 Ig-like domain repeat protein [Thermococcus sp. M39]NJE12870.1 Ig-like domain repeat protein [Thermococcus sp. LS2]